MEKNNGFSLLFKTCFYCCLKQTCQPECGAFVWSCSFLNCNVEKSIGNLRAKFF